MNTDTTKRYRLLKELPDSKVGDIYTWNDTFNHYYKEGNDYGGRWHSTYVENNPEWFEEVLPVSEPVKERVTVSIGSCAENYKFNNKTSFNTVFQTNIPITSELSPKVQQAIEKVLNNDTVVEDKNIVTPFDVIAKCDATQYWMNKYYDLTAVHKEVIDSITERKYTQSEVDTIRKEDLEFIKLLQTQLREQPTNDNAFVWTDELVILLCDFVHHNGWHKNGKRIVEEFDEFKSINPKKRIIPNWIKQHLQSKQSPPLSEIKEGEDKPVLFTTEDGVPRYKGDNCWAVQHPNFVSIRWVDICEEGMRDNLKYFFTKEATEKYILENKPCLSLNDLQNEWFTKDEQVQFGTWDGIPMYRRFKSIVKEKLK